MNDLEFIKFLCKELWNSATRGDEPDLEIIDKELRKRNIDPDDVFGY